MASDVEVEEATISLSYSQPDTFNEQMEDVKLKCQDITFSMTSPEEKIDQINALYYQVQIATKKNYKKGKQIKIKK